MSLPNTTSMTRVEREQLVSLVKQRAKLAKIVAAQRAAELRAAFEQQLDRRYSFDEDATWNAAYLAAEQATAEAEALIAKRSTELGIPTQFAPQIAMGWLSRGRNSCKAERAEMRRVAHSEIEACEKRARTEIERASVDLQTELVAGVLTSEAAKSFLERMPSVQALMPPLEIQRIEALSEDRAPRS
jgi:hypothetical protein